jgi:hypothetical protein
MIKNRRGDIPVTILVIGIVGICALAIISFYISDKNVRGGFEALELIEEIGLEAEKIMFYNNTGLSQEKISEIIEIKSDGQGRYLLIEQNKVWVRYNLP